MARTGRPRIHPRDEQPRTLYHRVLPHLHSRLEAAATANGCSISEEIQARLNHSFDDIRAAVRETMIEMSGRHYSDCAIHNAPAFPAGRCDCGMGPAVADAMLTLKTASVPEHIADSFRLRD